MCYWIMRPRTIFTILWNCFVSNFFISISKKTMSFYLCGKERKVGKGNELLQNSSCVLEIAWLLSFNFSIDRMGEKMFSSQSHRWQHSADSTTISSVQQVAEWITLLAFQNRGFSYSIPKCKVTWNPSPRRLLPAFSHFSSVPLKLLLHWARKMQKMRKEAAAARSWVCAEVGPSLWLCLSKRTLTGLCCGASFWWDSLHTCSDADCNARLVGWASHMWPANLWLKVAVFLVTHTVSTEGKTANQTGVFFPDSVPTSLLKKRRNYGDSWRTKDWEEVSWTSEGLARTS